MKRISLAFLLTLILTVGSFARSAGMSRSQIKQFEADVAVSLNILEGNVTGKRKFSRSELDGALRTISRACEMIALDRTAEFEAFAADCRGYLTAYHISTELVNVSCYVLKPAESPAPKPKATTNSISEPDFGFSDSDVFAYEQPINEYSDTLYGYSIGGGVFDQCADAKKTRDQALKDLNTCLGDEKSGLKKLGDFLGCVIGVFIGRPCKTN